MDNQSDCAIDLLFGRSGKGTDRPCSFRPKSPNLFQDISRLLSLAASSVALLTLPQTDDAAEPLPPGDERSEQFVLEVNEFFDRLNVRTCSFPFQLR